MKSKAWLLIAILLAASYSLGAQESHEDQLVISLTEGGFVVFKSETAWISTAKTTVSSPRLHRVFASQAMIDEDHVIHRVLVDSSGRPIFGYDLLVEPIPASRRFRIAVKPLDPKFESKLISAKPEAQAAGGTPHVATLPQTAEPQNLDDGDSLALDLLVNQTTGLKIVDIVKVSFDRSKLWEVNPSTLPRDFTLDAVELAIKDYRLLVNGEVIATGKPNSVRSGALLWFYVSERGRFIFSLVPREGYQFQKVGIVSDNRIEFTINGDRYEWISQAPILPRGGVWNLWVLHDPKYNPPVDDSHPDQAKEQNKWDQLDAAVNKMKNQPKTILDKKQSTFRNGTEPPEKQAPQQKRIRVITGGADRIENLWPK